MTSYSYDNLEPRFRRKAISDLGEQPDRLQAHIVSLRRWLLQAPHIAKCPSDDLFLLRFLRVAKFDQEKAQRRLENFCTVRGSPKRGLPTKFEYAALGDPQLDAYLRMGVHIPLVAEGKDQTVILIRFCQWDPAEFSYERLLTFTFMTMEVLLADEKLQIGGVAAIIDLGDLGKRQIDEMTKKRLILECVRIWTEGFPFRNHQILFYRESPVVDVALELFKFWLSPKLAARVHRVKHNISKIHEKMDGARAVLPREFDGDNGCLEACRQTWEARFRKHWSGASPSAEVHVDEAKRPMDTLAFLQTYEDVADDKFSHSFETLSN